MPVSSLMQLNLRGTLLCEAALQPTQAPAQRKGSKLLVITPPQRENRQTITTMTKNSEEKPAIIVISN